MIGEQRSVSILRIASALVALSLVTLIFIPGRFIYLRSFTEDGFYTLTVAKNIADGNGFTIDGTTMTNGFQPLFTMLCSIPFAAGAGNLEVAFQMLFAGQLILLFASAALIAACVTDIFPAERKKEIFWIILFVNVSSLYLFQQQTNALETGLLIFMYALVWRFFQTRFDGTLRSSVTLGALFGWLVLTRIDAGIFCAVWAILYLWNQRARNVGLAIRTVAVAAAVAAFISLPWWLYNIRNFGSVMPTSGWAQQEFAFSFQRIAEAAGAVVQNFVPFVFVGRYDGVYFDVVRIPVFVTMAVLAHKSNIRLNGRNTDFVALLSVSGMFIVVWYVSFSYAHYFYERYFIPIVLLSALLTGFVWTNVRSRRILAVLITVCCMPLLLRNVTALFNTSYDSMDHFHRSTNPQYRLTQQYVPADEPVGAGQSGSLGFLRSGVVNLDGKVNGEALLYRDSMRIYLDKKNIQWVCDTREYIRRYLTDYPSHTGWQLVAEDQNAQLYRRMHE